MELLQDLFGQEYRVTAPQQYQQGGIMATKNDITGDPIQTRTVTQTYRDNYDLIFGNKNGRTDEKKTDETEPESVEDSPSQE